MNKIGYIGICLVSAVGAYLFLNKDKNSETNSHRQEKHYQNKMEQESPSQPGSNEVITISKDNTESSESEDSVNTAEVMGERKSYQTSRDSAEAGWTSELDNFLESEGFGQDKAESFKKERAELSEKLDELFKGFLIEKTISDEKANRLREEYFKEYESLLASFMTEEQISKYKEARKNYNLELEDNYVEGSWFYEIEY